MWQEEEELMKKKGMLAAMAAFAMLLALTIPATAVGSESGFEDDDGNLAPNAAGLNFDWNSFVPTTWTGTAPNRASEKTVSPWSFDGIEDAQATTSDNGFAGGTKQDDECATVITAKAPNKDDLKRVYFASGTVNDHVYMNLAWVRIPQNTTSPSAHIAFEFNQSETACGGSSDGLVERSTTNGGDVLIVYDFEGGATDTPTIRLSRWIGTGACEVANHTPPCWGVAQLLGPGVAEARVNTSLVGSVTDTIQPPTAQNPLGLNEFGEAGIDLTDAGVFPPGECRSFGNAFAVSRTSGSSSTAQMKDLVGPGNVDIKNCGQVIIRKQTVPSPDPTDTTFDYSTTGGLDPATFDLKNGEAQDYGATVQAGDYTATEADPSGDNFTLTDIDCSASDLSHGSTFTENEGTLTASFTLAAEDTIDCTFVNTLKLGAIQVTKSRKHAADGPGNHPHAGVDFTVNGVTKTTDANGQACFDNLPFGAYTVHEVTPAGYSGEGDKTVTVDNVASCSDNPFVGETVSFLNTPLTDLSVTIDSQVPGGTASTVTCTPDGPSGSTVNGDGTFSDTNLVPGTYTCTIVIDP
jgi:Prealbumin-like fold domain